MNDLAFGFQAAPASDIHKSDQALYREVMEDCALGRKLGFDAAWLLEHHFSDYYPTPSPLLFMAHIAAAFPDLSLGTSVLVLPWYHPLRLAEEIAMLNGMTRGTLHLGIGRGTARMEYDAYNVDMNEARALGRRCPPLSFALQGPPAESDANRWPDIQEYQVFSRIFATLRKPTAPAELGPFMDSNLVGSPATICRRIDQLAALGFNYFMVSSATPGTPIELRQRMMTRFAREVCPRYSRAMRQTQAA